MNDVIELLDKLDENQEAGTKVKGLSHLLRALLFADDIILLAPTTAGLAKALQNFTTWCQLNELQPSRTIQANVQQWAYRGPKT